MRKPTPLTEAVAAIRTHNGSPVTVADLRWAATHEALCRSWIFDVLTGLADALEAESPAEEPPEYAECCASGRPLPPTGQVDTVRIGELFAGYGGLGMGVKAALGGEVAWVSEIEPGPCKVLAHRYPQAPNLGDITTVDWSTVEPVDVLTGGFPCQDVSTAGKRAGLRPGTRSGLWAHMAYAINQLRPPLVVIENVRGLLSAEAHSDMEPCPWCVGDDADGVLRALGAVLGDLADIGYDAAWCGLRAADVGAAHGRFRVFVVAYPADLGHERGWASRERWAGPADGGQRTVGMLPTPTSRDVKGHNQRHDATCLTGALLPTPAVNDMGPGKTPEAWDAWTDAMKARHGNGNGHGASLNIEVQRPLPTPKATNNENRQNEDRYGPNLDMVLGTTPGYADRFGEYADAIARHEQAFGHPAPDPTEPAPNGGRRLSCRFDEWLMGLPPGWVTDVPGVTHNEALRMCGNGVVPAQATAALTWLLDQMERAA